MVFKVGLKYYEDFLVKMDRTEVDEILGRVRAALISCGLDKVYELVPAGSYRRGAQKCGDCDILLIRLVRLEIGWRMRWRMRWRVTRTGR